MKRRSFLCLMALCAASCTEPTISATRPGAGSPAIEAPKPATPAKAAVAAKPAATLPTVLPAAPTGYDVVRPGIAQGQVQHIEYASKTSGVTRGAVVYLPPGYSAAGKYPILYLLHGAGGDETRWTTTGAGGAILDNLYADQKCAPMIVVMPNIFAPLAGAAPAAGRGGGMNTSGFEGDLLTDLMPYIEGHYPLLAGRQNRALVGLSAGGGLALNIGLHHLDLFAWVGGLSPAVNAGGARGGRGGGSAADTLVPDPAAVSGQLRWLWLSCGQQDSLLGTVQSLHSGLEAKAIPHEWHTQAGVHEWPVWKTDLYYLAPLLFRD